MSNTGKNSEKQVKLQEKFQAILSAMLREEDNKYCVDCDAKGPRWASWNLGVFLCIRCAGIHRNLGVHISKVKSVNLDQWTAEQIASMQAMGNSKARAVYEANLSDNFRRSQNDSAMEQFIRGKYEARKWIAKEWIPPSITELINDLAEEEVGKEKTKTATKPKVDIKVKPSPSSNSIKLNVTSAKTNAHPSKNDVKLVAPKSEPVVKEVSLFDFDSPPAENVSISNKPAEPNLNIFDSDSFPAFTNDDTVVSTTTTPAQNPNELENIFSGDQNVAKNDGKKDKQSILALYNNSNSSNNISGAPTNNNNNIFNNANSLAQNINPNTNNNSFLLQQQQQFSVFNTNNNTSNPMMPQGFPKTVNQQNFTHNNNSFPGNFNVLPQSNSMNLLNFDMHQLNINQSIKPSTNSNTMNPYLANMKPVNFNGTSSVQSNQLNFNAFPNSNTNSILPNIGNTFSTDLWQ